ncbi:MAG: cell division protein FtsL [Pseudomonadota bacterium]|jgi:cell division protein FtsL
MTKFNLILLVAVIASALLLVKTAYDARRLFTADHRADVEAVRLNGEHKRLEAERELQATNQRVDKSARERLKMATATPAITMYESAGAASAAAASAPSEARP